MCMCTIDKKSWIFYLVSHMHQKFVIFVFFFSNLTLHSTFIRDNTHMDAI